MKTRITVSLISLLGTTLLVALTASAQAQSSPSTISSAAVAMTTSPTQSSPAGRNTISSATYNTAQGQLTIHSTMSATPSTAAAPSFEQLANGKPYITKEGATAFPPLANDFDYAAHHGNRISKAQYESWLKHLN